MDKVERLKKLTGYIVERQNASITSLKSLRFETDLVRSNMLNLINALHMVGNRQFAEHKVLDGDCLSGLQLPRNKDVSGSGTMPATSDQSQEFDFISILLKAIELVPGDDDDVDDDCDDVDDDRDDVDHDRDDDDDDKGNDCDVVSSVSTDQLESSSDHEAKVDSTKPNNLQDEISIEQGHRANRDRVASILKRYSLYDDDDDEDDED